MAGRGSRVAGRGAAEPPPATTRHLVGLSSRRRPFTQGVVPRLVVVPCLFAAALAAAALARAQGAPPTPPAPAAVPVVASPIGPDAAPDAAPDPGTLGGFVGKLARALEDRAKAERAAGNVKLDLVASRGIDKDKAERVFLPRLRKRLRDGGVLVPTNEAALRARVTLSEEGGLVWAVTMLEGGPLPGPSVVAASVAVDKELEASIGVVVRPAQSRWVLERVGTLPTGVLDVALVDVDDDGADELVVLSVDGARTYDVAAGLVRTHGPVRLPGDRRWPRVPVGWAARADDDTVWFATSAGDALVLDARAGRFTTAPADGVPLRQPGPKGAGEPLLLASGRYGSPVLSLPLATIAGARVATNGLPPRVRDVVRWPGRTDAWVWVDEDGGLGAKVGDQPAAILSPERVGDRVVVADLDGDGEPEIAATAAAYPGEPDHVVLLRATPSLQSVAVLFRSPLSGGAIAAAAVGQLDTDGRADLVVVEETGSEALVWRLEHAP